jgi:GDPmannose 4,6-dehydratase
METAVVLGANGHCGSYLCELLLDKGYNVLGTVRRSSVDTTERIKGILNHENFSLVECDITDYSSVSGVLSEKPEFIYNTAAMSHVHTSFEQPYYTFQADAIGVLNILEIIRTQTPQSRLVQFSTSEMFGSNFTIVDFETDEKYQNEKTPLSPNSPYAVAKVAAYHLVQMYRKAYGLHVSSGIMFNMESPRRGENFVTRKITKYIAALVAGKNVGKLKLGNIAAFRDWGYSKDYMEAVYAISMARQAKDYVVCTGETHSVEEFLAEAFSLVKLDYRDYIEIDPKFYRPCEVEYLCGDASLIKKELGWEPKIKFKELVKMMVDADIEKVATEFRRNGLYMSL